MPQLARAEIYTAVDIPDILPSIWTPTLERSNPSTPDALSDESIVGLEVQVTCQSDPSTILTFTIVNPAGIPVTRMVSTLASGKPEKVISASLGGRSDLWGLPWTLDAVRHPQLQVGIESPDTSRITDLKFLVYFHNPIPLNTIPDLNSQILLDIKISQVKPGWDMGLGGYGFLFPSVESKRVSWSGPGQQTLKFFPTAGVQDGKDFCAMYVEPLNGFEVVEIMLNGVGAFSGVGNYVSVLDLPSTFTDSRVNGYILLSHPTLGIATLTFTDIYLAVGKPPSDITE